MVLHRAHHILSGSLTRVHLDIDRTLYVRANQIIKLARRVEVLPAMGLHLAALVRLALLLLRLLLHNHVLHLERARRRHRLIPRLKIPQCRVSRRSQRHEPIEAIFTDDGDQTPEPFLLGPLGLVIVELGVAFDLLDALHQLHIALEQLDVFLLLLVVVERMVLLHGVPCQVRLVVSTWYGKMLASLYLNESIE